MSPPKAPAGAPPGGVAPREAWSWAGRDVLAMRDLRAESIREILRLARGAPDEQAAIETLGSRSGRTVALAFFEASTRTRVSFCMAAQRLGARVLDAGGAASSVSKGETLTDTALTLEATGVSALVVRCPESGGPKLVAEAVSVPVVNAGDGRHEHPTQGLLDAFTVAEAHGRLEDFDLSGLRIALVGDLAGSRVARSDTAAFRALGAEVVLVGPPTLCPRSLEALGAEVSHDFDEVLGEVDVALMLRVQFERGTVIGTVRDYRGGFALTEERADRMKPGAIVMHPGPMNRGLEIDTAVADGPRSRVLRQVANGVRVRTAVLAAILG